MRRDLREKAEAMLHDRDLLSLHDDVASVGALIAKAFEADDDNRAVALMAVRARLVDTERRRLEVMQASITVVQAFAMVDAVVDVIVDHVPDPDTLAAIGSDVERVLRGVTDATGLPRRDGG